MKIEILVSVPIKRNKTKMENQLIAEIANLLKEQGYTGYFVSTLNLPDQSSAFGNDCVGGRCEG